MTADVGRMQHFVRDSEGADYKVGFWRDGEYVPGSREDALREYRLLAEPGSYVWGRLVSRPGATA